MLRDAEVQHPAGIGAQLVITGVKRVLQHELSAGVSFWGYDNVLSLYQEAVWRQQFYIEDAAHVGRFQVVGTYDVCLVPQGVAHEITLVVGMHIYFLLHLRH